MYELNIPLGEAEGSKAAVDDKYLDALATQISSESHRFAEKNVKI